MPTTKGIASGIRCGLELHLPGHEPMILNDVSWLYLAVLLDEQLLDLRELLCILNGGLLAVHVHIQLHQVVVLLAEQFNFLFVQLVLFHLAVLLDLPEDVLILVGVYEAKLFEVN